MTRFDAAPAAVKTRKLRANVRSRWLGGAALHALLITTGGDIAMQVVYCLRAMRCKISLLAGPEAGFVRFSRLLHRRYRLAATADGTGDRAIIEQIRELHRTTPFEAVLPGDQDATVLLARIKDEIGVATFPLPPPAIVERLADKARFAELCRELALPAPATVELRSKADIDVDSLVTALGLPLVIKPRHEQGGTGVVVAETKEMIRAKVLANDAYAFAPLVAQEFVPGIDMGVSLVARDGAILCLGTQMRRDGRLEFTECPPLETAVARLVSHLRYSGAANLDARFDAASGRAVFVECNPRFWTTISGALWCGTNCIEIGLGKRPADEVCVRVQTGRFSMRPLRFLLSLASLKLDRRAFSRAQLAGLWMTLSDPLPVLARALRTIRARVFRRGPLR